MLAASCALASGVSLGTALASANGKPQTLAGHPRKGANLLSTLADPALVGKPTTRLGRAYSGTPIDVTTYHYDNYRTGWNQAETDLTPATVASAKFGLLKTLSVDGNVFAEPLLVSNFVMPDGSKRNVLIIVTGHNSVYAFDAQTYATLWQVNLGKSQSTNHVGCDDVKPEYGISSTPIILRSAANAATLYVVAGTEPNAYEFHTQLHALNMATGADAQTPVEIAPSATLSDGSTLQFNAQNQWSRAGLAYNKGSLYVAIGSHCDNNAYGISGWLLRYKTTNLALQHAFHTIETPHGYELASIWMSGFAPAIDAAGNVFVVTGNGDFTGGARDWGESVLRLGPGLNAVLDKFTPANYGTLNNNDTDFGSGGVMLLPPVAGQVAPPMAVAMGKASVVYLLNQTKLGGLKANDAGALQSFYAGGGGLWGGPAYYNGPAGPTVYAQTGGDVLHAASVATASTTPTLTPGANGTTGAGYGGSTPIVSSNGTTANTGIVWVLRRSAPIQLEAYNALTLGAPIYAANAGSWSNVSNNNPFLTPLEANGRVYVPAYKTVKVFGLAP